MAFINPNRAQAAALSTPAAPEPPAPLEHTDLESIEVSGELATLFSTAKTLLNQVVTDPDVPANQRAQVLNSVTAILERITKTRTDLYNSERIRRLEQVLLRVMKDQPLELREEFVKQYEDALAR